MPYMCMGCNEIYDMDLPMCPKAGCEGDVVWIDELMVPIIKILREKGYITECCCSGHIYSDLVYAYVCLADFVTDELEEEEINKIRKNLPEEWTLEIGSRGKLNFHVKYNGYFPEDEIERWENIVKANMDFLKFVKELPDIEEYYEDEE